MSKRNVAIGGGVLAAIAGLFVWVVTPTKAGQCENVIAQMTNCIAAVPHKAPEQCQACLDEAKQKATALGLDPKDCGGPDLFESNRSCF